MRFIILFACYSLIITFSYACSSKRANEDNVGDNIKTKLDSLKKHREALNKQIYELENSLGVNRNDGEGGYKLVVTQNVKPSYFEHSIRLQGVVEAQENVLIYAKSAGVVTKIFVSEGDKVNKGQILAALDKSILQASLEEVETSLSLAEVLFKRQEALWKQKIGTEVQYLTSKNSRDTLIKKLATIKKQIENTKITAPLKGTIDNVIIKIGEMLNPGSAAFRIVNESKLKVRANVPERYIGMVKKNNPVEITFTDVNLATKSSISFVSRSIDSRTRSFIIDAPLKPASAIKPNMIAILKIIDYTNKEAITVPLELIQYINGSPIVLCVEDFNHKNKTAKAVSKPVVISRKNEHLAEIQSGLTSTDQIIIQGGDQINSGDIVLLSEQQ